MDGPLVSAARLREHLGDEVVRVVDCRFRLGEPGVAEELWREEHIPGATFLDVDRDLAAPPGERGRHPLPDADAFEAAARRAGIGATRWSWPTTRPPRAEPRGCGGCCGTSGMSGVVVLDGGLRGWRAERGRSPWGRGGGRAGRFPCYADVVERNGKH